MSIPSLSHPRIMAVLSHAKLRTAVCALAVGLAASALFAVVQSAPAKADTQSMPRTITVTGEGEAAAKPDMAIVFLGVVSQGKTAREAMSANNERMSRVIAGLKNLGIADKDVQTSGFSLSPRYTTPKEGGESRISGYEAQNQVSARLRDLSKLGSILDQAISLGANSMNGVSFTFAEPKKLTNDARREAVEDARSRAELYAQAAGVTLGRVHAITENGYSRPPMPMYAARDMMMKAESSVPMEAGESTMTANVSVVFEIQ